VNVFIRHRQVGVANDSSRLSDTPNKKKSSNVLKTFLDAHFASSNSYQRCYLPVGRNIFSRAVANCDFSVSRDVSSLPEFKDGFGAQ
jgi:hypothetical protein